MLWKGGRRSDNVEDQRGAGGLGGGGFGGGLGGGGFGGRRTMGVGGGLGLLAIVVVAMLFGVDPSAVLQGLDPNTNGGTYSQDQGQDAGTIGASPNDDEMKQFVETVLADTEDTWTAIFKDMGGTYQDPRLVLFSGL